MMKPRYTPGAWEADGANLLYAAPSEHDQFEVLEINAPYNSQDRQLIAYIPAGFEHSQSNARLIAAAPDLLEALIDAQEALGYLWPEKFDDAIHEANWTAKMNAIQAAIVKAKGRG